MQSTRKEALLVGDTHYNTGKPCKKGHISIRLTNSGACKECANHRQKTVRKNSCKKQLPLLSEMVTSKKDALLKGDSQYYTGTPCKHGHISPRRANTGECMECRKTHLQGWYKSNPEKIQEYSIKYADKASERYYKTIDHAKAVRSAYRRANKDLVNAKTVKYQTAKKNQLPKWVDANELWMMKEAYDLADMRSKLFGFLWHVDHIIPLQGKKVSGLHTISNLQVIPAIINTRKSNKWVTV